LILFNNFTKLIELKERWREK